MICKKEIMDIVLLFKNFRLQYCQVPCIYTDVLFKKVIKNISYTFLTIIFSIEICIASGLDTISYHQVFKILLLCSCQIFAELFFLESLLTILL